MAPELDRGYAPLFATWQQDPVAWRPSVDVILELLCPNAGERLGRRARLGPHGPLLALELVRLVPLAHPGTPNTALVEPDPRIVDHLLGEDGLDPRLVPVCKLLLADQCAEEADEAHVAAVERLGTGGALVLEATRPADGIDAAHALAARNDRPLLVLDVDRVATRGLDLERALILGGREAALAGAVLCLTTAGDLPRPIDELVTATPGREPLLVVTPDARTIEGSELDVLVARLSPPDPSARERMWASALGEVPPDADLPAIASRFQLGNDEIAGATRAARSRARMRAVRGGDGRLTSADLYAAARAGAPVRSSPSWRARSSRPSAGTRSCCPTSRASNSRSSPHASCTAIE